MVLSVFCGTPKNFRYQMLVSRRAGHTLPSSLKLLVLLLTSASIIREKAQMRSDNDERAIQAAALPSKVRISTRMPFADTNLERSAS